MHPKTVESGLLGLWWLYVLLLIPSPSTTFFTLCLVVSPLLIGGFRGVSWMEEVRWESVVGFGLVMYFALTGISQFVGPSLVNGLDGLRKLPLKYVLILGSLIFLLRERDNAETLITAIPGTILIAVVFAYYNATTPNEWHLVNNISSDIFPGSVSPFGYHKNGFAGNFSFLLPVVLSMALLSWERNGPWRPRTLFYGLLVVLSLPVLVWTQSRTGQVAVLFGLLIVGAGCLPTITRRLEVDWKTLVTGLGCLAVLGGLGFGFFLQSRSFTRWQHTDDPVNVIQRLKERSRWEAFQNKFSQRPWFGTDFTNSDYNYNEHNIYLHYLLRSGVVGLAGYLLLIGSVLYAGVSTLVRTDDSFVYWAMLGFLAGFTAGEVLTGLAESFSWFWVRPVVWAFLFMLTGTALQSPGWRKDRHKIPHV